ncbi:MAG TPA: hypothetical protein VHD31_02770 [Candidatus Paceibacterota bacterium]|nr:hypothetical protein [Candidatus Paceibacterota bacterium]
MEIEEGLLPDWRYALEKAGLLVAYDQFLAKVKEMTAPLKPTSRHAAWVISGYGGIAPEHLRQGYQHTLVLKVTPIDNMRTHEGWLRALLHFNGPEDAVSVIESASDSIEYPREHKGTLEKVIQELISDIIPIVPRLKF